MTSSPHLPTSGQHQDQRRSSIPAMLRPLHLVVRLQAIQLSHVTCSGSLLSGVPTAAPRCSPIESDVPVPLLASACIQDPELECPRLRASVPRPAKPQRVLLGTRQPGT